MSCGCARPGVCFHCMLCGADLSVEGVGPCLVEGEGGDVQHIAYDGEGIGTVAEAAAEVIAVYDGTYPVAVDGWFEELGVAVEKLRKAVAGNECGDGKGSSAGTGG